MVSATSLACVSPSWLPCLIRSVAPNPRIQRSEFVNSYQQQLVCCLVFSFFILSPSQDLMHCTLSLTVGLCTPCQKSKLHQHNRFFILRGHDPYTLACKARPSFDGCRTSLSVSLSLPQLECLCVCCNTCVAELFGDDFIVANIAWCREVVRCSKGILQIDVLKQYLAAVKLLMQQMKVQPFRW